MKINFLESYKYVFDKKYIARDELLWEEINMIVGTTSCIAYIRHTDFANNFNLDNTNEISKYIDELNEALGKQSQRADFENLRQQFSLATKDFMHHIAYLTYPSKTRQGVL